MAIGFAPFGFYNKKSSSPKSSGYEFQPYTGPTPPAVDTDEKKILRPTQAQLFDILMRRSAGQDVGYDPAMKQQAIELLGSQLGRREEDEVRDARGVASRSGLGGNLAAQSALEGKVRRDIGRTYGEGVAQINIEDLARANEERDINTGRLQAFNNSNFGQENTRANFGLDQYQTEQGLQRGSAQDALAQRNFDLTRRDNQFNDVAGLALAGADLYATSKGIPSITGQGIAPSSGLINNNQPSDTLSALMRAKQKRSSYYPGVPSIYN